MVSLKFKKLFCVLYSGLLFISGLILVTVSAILLYRVFHHFDFMPGSTVGPLILLLILGVIHLFLTWMGVKGPTLEHTFHIVLFIVFTIILLIIEFTIGVWSMVLRDGAGTHSTDLITEAFNEMVKEEFYDKNFAKLQADLECCGIDGPTNYQKFMEKISLTYTSCKNNIVIDTNVDFEPFTDGCTEVFADYIRLLLLESALLGFFCTVLHGFGLYVIISFYKTLRLERTKRLERRAELQRELSAQNQPLLTPPPIGMAPPPIGISPPKDSEVPPTAPVRPRRERSSTPSATNDTPPERY